MPGHTRRVDVSGRAIELREVDLDTFLHPQRVAVIGASDVPGKPNANMTARIKEWAAQHGAEFFPVHPEHESVFGVPCVRSVDDIHGDLDLAIILTGTPVEQFEEVVARKVAFAVIFAAGFSEAGKRGERLEARLADLVARGDTHLLGPNTNLNAFSEFRTDLPGPSIALITQSGHQGRPVFQGQELGIAVSHWAPTGNEVDLEFADFARYFADQPEVGVIAAYIEGFKDGRALLLAADHAAKRRKPIVVVKVGRTTEGRSMAKAHTGHLTGADAVVSAAFRQYGVTRVDGLDELLEVSAAFARTTEPRGDGVCIYAVSGGTGAHMADMAAAAGLRLPRLTTRTQRALHDGLIPPYLRVSNPVDCGGPPVADQRGRRILDTILEDPRVDILIVPITGAVDLFSDPLTRDLVAVARTTDKPIFTVWGAPPGTDDTYYRRLLDGGLPTFRTFANCVTAVKAYVDYWAFVRRYRSPFDDPPMRPRPAAAAVRRLLAGTPHGGTLSEHASKQVLRAYGIRAPREVLCTSAAEAVRVARQLGHPVVMKAVAASVTHKSDLGLVEVGVASDAGVRATYARLTRAARRHLPRGEELEGVLVSELVRGGVEMVVGVAQDDLFGPVVMTGLGGVFVEVLRDVTFRIPPFGRDEAERMLRELKAFPLLEGARGSKPADLDALVDAIMNIERLAMDLADEIAEIDINPLIVKPRGAVALDALVVRR